MRGFGSLALLSLVFASFGLFGLGFYFGKATPKPDSPPTNPTEEELLNNPSDDSVLGIISEASANTLPPPGFKRQSVKTDSGTFTVDIVAADLNFTRVTVDTASEGDCRDNCPVLSLGEYVKRNGAYAGINGPYFCPFTYASCQGKKNSFDTLIMNKNKKYFNSDNNVYSTVPAVIFSGSSARFVSQSLEWGRDTGVDSVIANYPLLVFNGQQIFTGSGDGKLSGKGGRSFIANKGSMVYIGVVRGASVADSAKVLHTLGVDNALNLDSGGSTALYHGGYKIGPGRGLPFAILFQKK